jgi:hypothetical protein
LAAGGMLQELGSFPICQRKNRYKCENIHSQLRYRTSTIHNRSTYSRLWGITVWRNKHLPIHFRGIIHKSGGEREENREIKKEKKRDFSIVK